MSVTDLVPPLTDFNANGFRIKSVGQAVVSTDAINLAQGDSRYIQVGQGATKAYVDTGLATKMPATTKLNGVPGPDGSVSLAN